MLIFPCRTDHTRRRAAKSRLHLIKEAIILALRNRVLSRLVLDGLDGASVTGLRDDGWARGSVSALLFRLGARVVRVVVRARLVRARRAVRVFAVLGA